MWKEILTHFSYLEMFGAAFGVIQVLLARKNNVHNYLFGISNILISIWLYFEAKLYADILLNLYYLVMSIYGWFYWKFGRGHHKSPITRSNRADYIKAIVLVVSCFILMFFVLSSYTDSDVPFWDALVSGFAWAGMWLMAKRKLENWLFLNMSNLIAFPLMIYKGLYIYSGLTLFLFVIAILGYLNWQKLVRGEQRGIK